MTTMRITFYGEGLHGGGAARVMSVLLNAWAERGETVNLLTMDDGSATPNYTLHPAITHRCLDIERSSSNPIVGLLATYRRVRILRKAILETKPDVVISFLSRLNVTTVLAMKPYNTPVLVSERTDPAQRSIGRVWEYLRNKTYAEADCVVMQTERSRHYFSDKIQKRIQVIANPLTIPPEAAMPRQESDSEEKRIMALGSLRSEKGFDLLINAFAKSANQHPEWTLNIWGEGGLRETLEAQVRSLGMEGRIHLPGQTRQPFEKLRESDIFVLSSWVEGFPNALLEAMAMGLAVISFDCPSGPSELIRPDYDGILLPPKDEEALTKALDTLMGDAKLRRQLAAHAPEVRERYSTETVLAKWDAEIQKAIMNRKKRA